MNITFTGKKMEIKQNQKNWAEKKLGKLDKYFDDNADVKLVIGKQKEGFTVECTVYSKGMIFRVEETNDDLFLAIDHVVPAIERQIRKNKTRLAKRLRSGATDIVADEPETFTEEKEFKITKVKTVPKKPMSAEEAILQMNLLDHTFFLFENSETGESSLVYKRKDGNYGLIEIKE